MSLDLDYGFIVVPFFGTIVPHYIFWLFHIRLVWHASTKRSMTKRKGGEKK